MSGRLANLSFNRVDWRVHGELQRVLASGSPDALTRFLREATLPEPTDSDRYAVEQLDKGRFPPSLEWTRIDRLLIVDRERFIPRVRWWIYEREEEGDRRSDAVKSKLGALAFPGGSTRWYGDVWLTSPAVVLAWVSPRFRDVFVGGFHELRDAAPRARDAPESPFVEAFGGLEATDDELVPGDALYDPAAVRRIAEALRREDPHASPPESSDALRAIVEEHYPELLEDEEAGTGDPLAESCAQELRDVRSLFEEAAHAGEGLDVYWHPNP